MKNAIVIFLSSLYLLGATEAYQLLKIPFLVEHYKTHQQFDNKISFTKFIKMHYFQQQTYDSDYQQDMQLPFKSSNRTVSLLNFVTLFVPKQIVTPNIFFKLSRTYLVINDEEHISYNYGNIFQPPRA